MADPAAVLLAPSAVVGDAASWTLALLAGASILSLLPAGAPGVGERTEVSGAAAGVLALGLLAGLVAQAVAGGTTAAAALLAVPIALAVARRLLGPAALRPRRPLPTDRAPASTAAGRCASALGVAVPLALLAPLVALDCDADLVALTLAVAAFVGAHAFWLRVAGAGPLARRALALVAIAGLLWLPARFDPRAAGTAATAAAAVVPVLFAAVFLRRAERRCLHLATLSLAAGVLAVDLPAAARLGGGALLALGLVAVAPAPSRPRAAGSVAVAAAVVALVSLRGGAH